MREELWGEADCIPVSFTKFAWEQAHLAYCVTSSLLVALAVRRCSSHWKVRWSHYQMLNWAWPWRLQADSQREPVNWKHKHTGCTCCEKVEKSCWCSPAATYCGHFCDWIRIYLMLNSMFCFVMCVCVCVRMHVFVCVCVCVCAWLSDCCRVSDDLMRCWCAWRLAWTCLRVSSPSRWRSEAALCASTSTSPRTRSAQVERPLQVWWIAVLTNSFLFVSIFENCSREPHRTLTVLGSGLVGAWS